MERGSCVNGEVRIIDSIGFTSVNDGVMSRILSPMKLCCSSTPEYLTMWPYLETVFTEEIKLK